MFNIERLEQARKRRRYTAKILAEKSGVAPVTLSRVINGKQTPDEQTITRLIKALDFPVEFFDQDTVDEIDVSAASFRSLTAMTARERDAALSAGSLAYEVADWLNDRYQLPVPDLIDLSHERSPSSAARTLRQHWTIGEKPIGNMIKLLESKGIRVFSLAESTKNVDAFSVWRNDEPYIFLNTFKTAERSRFDAAHELGHLVLHKHGGPNQRSAEIEANEFAGAFLMPSADVRSRLPYTRSLDQIIAAKVRWGVSAAALCYSLHKMGLITEWQYRTFCIQLNQRYRNLEPNGMEKEKSAIWQMVLNDLWSQGQTRTKIARDLSLPDDELENLIFGLTTNVVPPAATGRAKLSAVK
ncbi:Zn-dependent peptidase ImmA (M78 family)/DNA-binding XRE family transcriptional regulator [Phyllobacterium trifolii]|uniref:Zn-dependent peptidase ImmA (M78 family)/DNA-binding XRE family transcriptional regulator n=1 Tax=Phyllobacterium trifolii TaxID=300193 RepID=A0A839U2S6_9HYPH|nr:XRE family transcriptional regulator [Phyllobacterium trifolii]MBB3144958.1 Zn-dependent peptidase ImmA (M78 family)/DNA-binding XRE family transcriptional regulator [Phyllobacterium trifolii]